MDTTTTLLALMTATLAIASLHAWILGNDRRDVALLGTLGGGSGVGTALAAIL